MRIGLDLGGTKIEVIALDDSGNILLRRRMPTPAGDYAGTIAAIVHLAREAQNDIGGKGALQRLARFRCAPDSSRTPTAQH